MISELPSGMEWRLLGADDVEMIRALAADCLAVDGGLYFAARDPYFRDKYAPLWQGTAIGGFDGAGSMMACAGVKFESPPDESWCDTVGMVHPDHRARGIGTALVAWSIAEARTLFESGRTTGSKTLYLYSDYLTAATSQLCTTNGFVLDNAYDVMRRDLQRLVPEPSFPKGITLAEWSEKAATDFFDAYHAAFRERPGYPGWSAEFWIARALEDQDFSPERSLVAYADGQPVGFITCFNDWIGQVGVRPEWRKQGLGSALVVEILHRVANAGGNAVWLDVNTNNPEATRVYSQLDFDFVGRRGSYALILT